MLFAISGSQGSGKSTTINALAEQGFPIVERKTSRSILEEWGVTLSEVNNDRPLTVKFQDEILKRKFVDERPAALDPSTIYFTERTYADLFTYALIAIGKDNEYSNWLNDYYQRCKQYQGTYKHIFYLPAGRFKVEHDGVRGSNQHYARLIDRSMQSISAQMQSEMYDGLTFEAGAGITNVKTTTLEHRVNEILSDISEHLVKPIKYTEEV